MRQTKLWSTDVHPVCHLALSGICPLLSFAARDGSGGILDGLAVARDAGEFAFAGDVLMRRKFAKNENDFAGEKGYKYGDPSGSHNLADVDGPIELQRW